MPRVATADYEAPRELVEAAYEALKVAAETGKVRRGTNEATKAIERGVAKLVYIADDTSPVEIVLHLPLLCRERGVPYIVVPEKKMLGGYAGLEVPAAAACIIDAGQAARPLEDLVRRIDALRKKG